MLPPLFKCPLPKAYKIISSAVNTRGLTRLLRRKISHSNILKNVRMRYFICGPLQNKQEEEGRDGNTVPAEGGEGVGLNKPDKPPNNKQRDRKSVVEGK